MRKAILAIITVILLIITPSMALDFKAERYITPALAKPGDEVTVNITVFLPEEPVPVGIKDTVPYGWNISEPITNPSALCKVSQNTVECVFVNVSNKATVSYKLKIPKSIAYDEYLLSGEVYVRGESDVISGENTVMVSDSIDESPPIIQSVNVTPQPVEPGDQIYVKVTASDDVGVLSVKADGVWLLKSGDSWEGYLTAQPTGVLNVTVRDYSGKTTSESFNYEIVAPTANTTVTTAETPVNTTTTVTTTVETTTTETTTTVTTSVSTTVTTATETPTETPANTTVTTTTPTETATETTTVETTATETTVTETATPRTPGFGSAIVVIVLLTVAYLVRRL